MKALRLHGSGDLRLHDEPDPEPGDGDILLRVTAVGCAAPIATGSSTAGSATRS
jgi:NADPH:quinone reductase-like Zn-dependent oxidoreductase